MLDVVSLFSDTFGKLT